MREKRRYRDGGGFLNIIYFIALAFALLLSNASLSSAEGVYIVKKGDTLYSLSKRFKTDAERIIDVNGLSSSVLKPGMRLLITDNNEGIREVNAASSKDTGRIVQRPAAKPKPAAFSNSGPDDFHIVKKGDTLSSIARKYSLDVNYLKEINPIGSSKKIKIGQQIRLKRTGPKTYTVKNGDNIDKIARKFGLNVDDLVGINELDSIDLKAGQRLIVEEWSEGSENKSRPLNAVSLSEEIRVLSDSLKVKSISLGERSVIFAKKMLDIPYKFGGSSFIGIDCSAYVQKVYSFIDLQLPRTAREQFRVGESVNREDLSIGDLVFFRTYASFPSHVGIYLGDNLFIHASSKDRKVTINSLNSPYYLKRFIGAKRLITEEPEEDKTKETVKKADNRDS